MEDDEENKVQESGSEEDTSNRDTAFHKDGNQKDIYFNMYMIV